MPHPTPDQTTEDFERLQSVLDSIHLNNAGQDWLPADAGEFMHMGRDGGSHHALFKHTSTRNYVYLALYSLRLMVPVSGTVAFNRGTFQESTPNPGPSAMPALAS